MTETLTHTVGEKTFFCKFRYLLYNIFYLDEGKIK